MRTALEEALVNMKGYFNPFEIKRYKLTSLFHPNLMPNLEETKILIPGVKKSQHIYPPLNPNATSLANSVFTPFCVNGIASGLIILLVKPFCHLKCESNIGRGYFFLYMFVEEGEPMRWHTLVNSFFGYESLQNSLVISQSRRCIAIF